MKKTYIFFTLIIFICVVFCSCNPQKNIANVTSTTSATITKAETAVASTTKKQYYREGYTCNQIKQDDYEHRVELIHSAFDINKDETQQIDSDLNSTIYGLFNQMFSVETNAYVENDTYYNKHADISCSKSVNDFFQHYFNKYLKVNYNFKTGKQNENEKLILLNDPGYEITNFTCDCENMFYYSTAFILSTHPGIEDPKNVTLKKQFDKIFQKKDDSYLSAPIYYNDEFAGLYYEDYIYERFFDKKYKPLKDILNIVKSKSDIDKWCKSFGITGVQDVVVAPAITDYVGRPEYRSVDVSYGLIVYVKTSSGDYVYTKNVMGLSKYNEKMTKFEELIDNSNEYNRLCKKYPVYDYSTG